MSDYSCELCDDLFHLKAIDDFNKHAEEFFEQIEQEERDMIDAINEGQVQIFKSWREWNERRRRNIWKSIKSFFCLDVNFDHQPRNERPFRYKLRRFFKRLNCCKSNDKGYSDIYMYDSLDDFRPYNF